MCFAVLSHVEKDCSLVMRLRKKRGRCRLSSLTILPCGARKHPSNTVNKSMVGDHVCKIKKKRSCQKRTKRNGKGDIILLFSCSQLRPVTLPPAHRATFQFPDLKCNWSTCPPKKIRPLGVPIQTDPINPPLSAFRPRRRVDDSLRSRYLCLCECSFLSLCLSLRMAIAAETKPPENVSTSGSEFHFHAVLSFSIAD